MKVDEHTKVSIIIPTYKRPDRISRAVNSALNQDYDNFEVIVVDDNHKDSKDKEETLNNLRQFFNDSKFKLIQHSDNKNGSAARNTGIRNSNGKYITFLDDDDEYYEDKIRLQAETLDRLSDEWAMCYTAYDKIDQHGKFQQSAERVEGDVFLQALTKNLYVGSGSNFMVRRSAVARIKGFDESFTRNQDLEFMVRILKEGKIKYIDTSTFLIHNEIRERQYSYDELIDIDNYYRTKMKHIINNLDREEALLVNKILDLGQINCALRCKKWTETRNIYRNSSITVYDFSKYAYYLLKRLITKKSYGFKL
ncbi:glycosyltransferase family A protein [Aerococcus sp. UMB7834]|uniref:glycosyltransferase family 2 protein n=1 Tax=Aerococcus sp. UMB7834 TaxID=3046342 RepID=UPI00254E6E8B|nr:glycosyltransferase family A protein [Aerococcus sp. UMB7834]MDK6805095.1 glycosyltransferase family A protein [Aerococcus sp. UMB7834]